MLFNINIKQDQIIINSPDGVENLCIKTPYPIRSLNSTYGIIGLIKHNDVEYILLITNAKIVGEVTGIKVYEVQYVKVIPTSSNFDTIFVNEIELFFKTTPGFYFSNYCLYSIYKLHGNNENYNTFSQIFDRHSLDSSYESIHVCDTNTIVNRSDFIFNKPILSNFIKKYETNTFCIKLIFGYFGQIDNFILISRRSIKCMGPRYFCRGADLEGNTANFVETEQIIDGKCSFINIRGSMSLSWKTIISTRWSPEIYIDLKNSENTIKKHHGLLTKLYPNMNIIYLNLVKSSGVEQQLRDAYTHFITENGYKLFNFDFFDRIKTNAYPFDFSAINPQTCFHNQKIIIRTNCIDSLDRTNIMQYYITKTVLNKYIQSKDIDKLKCLWIQNGSYLSMQYAGTPALHSRYIVENKMLMAFSILIDGLQSVKRYFINRLGDIETNKIYRLLLENKDAVFLKRREYYYISNRNIFFTVMGFAIILLTVYIKKNMTTNTIQTHSPKVTPQTISSVPLETLFLIKNLNTQSITAAPNDRLIKSSNIQIHNTTVIFPKRPSNDVKSSSTPIISKQITMSGNSGSLDYTDELLMIVILIILIILKIWIQFHIQYVYVSNGKVHIMT